MSSIHPGFKIPQVPAGKILGRKKANLMIRVLNAVMNGRIVRGQSDKFHLSDNNSLFELKDDFSDSLGPENMHPFKLYPAQLKTGDDTAKPWRYWQCRGGLVEFPGTFDHFRLDYSTVIDGSDGIVGGINNLNFDWFTNSTVPDWPIQDVIVSNTGNHGVATTDHGGRFILDGTSDAVLCVGAGFWLEGTADGSGNLFDWEIKARMFSHLAGGTGRGSDPFPAEAPNIIPIGIVRPPGGMDGGSGSGPTTLIAEQYQTTHIINRTPPNPGYYWNVLGEPFVDGGFGPLRFRGYWEATDAFGLSGEFFYHGDCVLVLSTGPTVAVTGGGGGNVTLPNYWQLFVKLGNATASTIPATGDPAWQALNGW